MCISHSQSTAASIGSWVVLRPSNMVMSAKAGIRALSRSEARCCYSAIAEYDEPGFRLIHDLPALDIAAGSATV